MGESFPGDVILLPSVPISPGAVSSMSADLPPMTRPTVQLKCQKKAFAPGFFEYGDKRSLPIALTPHSDTRSPFTSGGTLQSVTHHKVNLLKNLEGGVASLWPNPSQNQIVFQKHRDNV